VPPPRATYARSWPPGGPGSRPSRPGCRTSAAPAAWPGCAAPRRGGDAGRGQPRLLHPPRARQLVRCLRQRPGHHRPRPATRRRRTLPPSRSGPGCQHQRSHPAAAADQTADPGRRTQSARGHDRRSRVRAQRPAGHPRRQSARAGPLRVRVHPAARQVNLARFCFLDPVAEAFYPDWAEAADTTVNLLRTEAGRDPYNKELTDLVGELATRSDQFRTRWAEHNMRLHHTGVKHLQHPPSAGSTSPSRSQRDCGRAAVMSWNTTTIRHLANAGEIGVLVPAPERAGRLTPIWVVAVDDNLYVRSWKGEPRYLVPASSPPWLRLRGRTRAPSLGRHHRVRTDLVAACRIRHGLIEWRATPQRRRGIHRGGFVSLKACRRAGRGRCSGARPACSHAGGHSVHDQGRDAGARLGSVERLRQ
jgi:transcription regulator MmyB-like protein